MSKVRAFFSLLVLAIVAGRVLAQAPAAGDQQGANGAHAEPLPEGARLRLGNVGLGAGEGVSGAAISTDGKYLALGSRDGATLFDRVSGKRVAQLGGNNMAQGLPVSVAFSPKGNVLAVSSFRNVALFECPSGNLLHNLGANGALANQNRGLTFSADGSVVAHGMQFGGGNNKAKAFVWEVATGKALGPIEVLQRDGCSTALSPDGKRLATWGRHFQRMPNDDREPAQTVQLWDLATATELRKFKVDSLYHEISAAAFSTDGKTLAVASGLATFYIFDVESGKPLRRFAGRRGQIAHLQFSPDGKLLVAGNSVGTVQAWHTGSGERLELPAGPKAQLLGFAFPGAGQMIALGMSGQAVIWWDVVTGKSSNPAPGHVAPVFAVAFTPNGKTLRSVGIDGEVLSWDTASGKLQKQFGLIDEETLRFGGNPSNQLNSLALSADASTAATTSIFAGNSVHLWDLANGRIACDFELSKPGGVGMGLALSDTGNRLAAAGMGKVIDIWDCKRGEQVGTIPYDVPGNAFAGAPPQIAISANGKSLAVIAAFIEPMKGIANRFLLIDAASGKAVTSFAAPAGNFGGGLHLRAPLAFSPDSKLLALPAADRSILLTRTATGNDELRLPSGGNVGAVSALAFSPDGRTLAVSYAGNAVGKPKAMANAPSAVLEIWELASGKLRAEFTGHRGSVNCFAFASDGLTLASGGADTTVILWDISGLHNQKPATLTERELDGLWADLSKPDAKAAFRAQCRLRLAPAETLAFLSKEVKPAKTLVADRKQIDALVANLDSDNFETRDEAHRSLERIGPPAESALTKARMGKVSLEMRRRVDELLARLERRSLSAEELRAVRAVEILERIATPAAHALLATWATGAEESVLTRETKAAAARKQR